MEKTVGWACCGIPLPRSPRARRLPTDARSILDAGRGPHGPGAVGLSLPADASPSPGPTGLPVCETGHAAPGLSREGGGCSWSSSPVPAAQWALTTSGSHGGAQPLVQGRAPPPLASPSRRLQAFSLSGTDRRSCRSTAGSTWGGPRVCARPRLQPEVLGAMPAGVNPTFGTGIAPEGFLRLISPFRSVVRLIRNAGSSAPSSTSNYDGAQESAPSPHTQAVAPSGTAPVHRARTCRKNKKVKTLVISSLKMTSRGLLVIPHSSLAPCGVM